MFPALAGEFFTTRATWEGPVMMRKAGQMLLRDERWCLILFSLLVPPPPNRFIIMERSYSLYINCLLPVCSPMLGTVLSPYF